MRQKVDHAHGHEEDVRQREHHRTKKLARRKLNAAGELFASVLTFGVTTEASEYRDFSRDSRQPPSSLPNVSSAGYLCRKVFNFKSRTTATYRTHPANA